MKVLLFLLSFLLFNCLPSSTIIFFFVLLVCLIITPSYLVTVSHTDILTVASPTSSCAMLPAVNLFYFYTRGLAVWWFK